jgi:hypothetical protein
MKNLIFLLFMPLFCFSQSNGASQFYKELGQRFARIDTIAQEGAEVIILDPDGLQRANDSLRNLLLNSKELVFDLPDTADFDLLFLSKSEDKQLCLVSWDTRMGGTMIDFTTMAFYKTSSGIQASEIEEENGDHTKLHFDTLHTLVGKDQKKIYLAYGYGQGSLALPWQEVRAFSIQDNNLVTPPVFPGNEFRLFVEFDTHEFDEGNELPRIKWKKNGKQILMPRPTAAGGFAGKYTSLQFNGSVFN